LALFTILLLVLSPLRAADFGTRIVMKEKAAATYYTNATKDLPPKVFAVAVKTPFSGH
jgi:hypothetical protein